MFASRKTNTGQCCRTTENSKAANAERQQETSQQTAPCILKVKHVLQEDRRITETMAHPVLSEIQYNVCWMLRLTMDLKGQCVGFTEICRQKLNMINHNYIFLSV